MEKHEGKEVNRLADGILHHRQRQQWQLHLYRDGLHENMIDAGTAARKSRKDLQI